MQFQLWSKKKLSCQKIEGSSVLFFLAMMIAFKSSFGEMKQENTQTLNWNCDASEDLISFLIVINLSLMG